MDSYDNIQPLIGRRFILPFIVSFFANILLFCYELNTGFEHILNQKNPSFILVLVFGITQIVNSWIIASVVIAISIDIGSKFHIKATDFIFLLTFTSFFVIFFVCLGISCLSISTKSLVDKMSTDSRLQIQCTVLLVSQIGLFVSYCYWK